MAFAEIQKTIGPAQDHADNLAHLSWITATHGTNLITLDQLHIGQVTANYTTSTSQDMNGLITDWSRYLLINADVRHNAQRGNGRVIQASGSFGTSGMMQLKDAYGVLDGIEFDGNGNTMSYAIKGDEIWIWVNGNFIYDVQSTDNVQGINVESSHDQTYTNNIIADVEMTDGSSSNDAFGFKDNGLSTRIFYMNNTVIDIRSSSTHAASDAKCYAINDNSSKFVHNNLGFDTSVAGEGNTDCFSYGASPSNVTHTGNMASDTTGDAGGDSKTSSSQFVSVTRGSENLNLKAGADALNFVERWCCSGWCGREVALSPYPRWYC